jgi:hypothetical protein
VDESKNVSPFRAIDTDQRVEREIIDELLRHKRELEQAMQTLLLEKRLYLDSKHAQLPKSPVPPLPHSHYDRSPDFK